MNFKIFFITILSAIISFSSTNADDKIVYVDMDLLLNSSSAGKNITSSLSKNHKKRISELKLIEEELKKDEVEIIQQKNILSKEEFDKKILALRDKASKYQKQRNESNDTFNKKRNAATSQLIKIIRKIIGNHAIKNDISIIIQKRNIIMGKSELDITSDILKVLNDQHKTLKIE